MMTYDVAVVGLGAMGSATTYHLARQGATVVGIDQHSPPHPYGSTHGDTRISRVAVAEGPGYVPLVQRSHDLWRELEADTGTELLRRTGGVVMASASVAFEHHGAGDFVTSSVDVAREYGIEHDVVDTDELRRRFPAFRLGSPHRGYYEPGAGLVFAERAVQAHLAQARRHGATLRFEERVAALTPTASGVTVRTDGGSYAAATAILTVGPWLPRFVEPEIAGLFSVRRHTMYWYDVDQSVAPVDAARLPIFIWGTGSGPDDSFYGFPAVDGPNGGLKLGGRNSQPVSDPETVRREVTAGECREAYGLYVRGRIPWLRRRVVRAVSCLNTYTPDFGFVIDRHPEHRAMIIASPCSGHGFKHSAAVGEAVSRLATGRTSRVDLTSFSLDRFDLG